MIFAENHINPVALDILKQNGNTNPENNFKKTITGLRGLVHNVSNGEKVVDVGYNPKYLNSIENIVGTLFDY